jgi:hypothetical protein
VSGSRPGPSARHELNCPRWRCGGRDGQDGATFQCWGGRGAAARRGVGAAVMSVVMAEVVRGVDGCDQTGAVAGNGAFDGVGEVVPQMPPVRHLQRLGGAGPGAFKW